MLLLFCFFVASPIIAEATGWVNESVGQDNAIYNFQKYPLENYALDFYVDTSWSWLPWKWGEGIGDAVIYGIYALTNVLWLLNVYISYFIGYIVQEAFDLDFITRLISSTAGNMQRIAGIDASGLRETGLFPRFMPLIIAIFGCYIAYVGGIKRQTTRAVQHAVVFMIIFVASGAFLMKANTYLTSINNAQKEINNEMLVIAKTIMPSSNKEEIIVAPGSPTEQEQLTKQATNAIRENLFEVQVHTPWLLLQYGDSNAQKIGTERIDKLLMQTPLVDGSARADIVTDEVTTKNNMNLSVQGAFLRFGMTLLVIVSNGVISYSVAVLTIIMITSQIMFLLFCAFLPVAMLFSLFPSSNRILFTALQKVIQALMTKMGITLILAVAFALSHSFFSLAKSSGYIWVAFLQIAIWLTTVNKVNELLGFMALGGAETKSGSRVGRMAKNVMMAGLARNVLRKSAPSPKAAEPTKPTRKHTPAQGQFPAEKIPASKRLGATVSNVKDMPNQVAEKVNAVKDSVKQSPVNAKHKAMTMRDNYTEGRIGQEIKNNGQRTARTNQQHATYQQRLDALKQREEWKKDAVRNQLAHKTPQSFDQIKLQKKATVPSKKHEQAASSSSLREPTSKSTYKANDVSKNSQPSTTQTKPQAAAMDEKNAKPSAGSPTNKPTQRMKDEVQPKSHQSPPKQKQHASTQKRTTATPEVRSLMDQEKRS